MRLEDIRFKAKSFINDEWVKGFYFRDSDTDNSYILIKSGECIEVDPSTVCQYTGLKDEVGNLIYENDIIQDDGADRYIIEYKNCCFVMIDYCGLLSDIIDEGVLRRDWILLGSKFDKEV